MREKRNCVYEKQSFIFLRLNISQSSILHIFLQIIDLIVRKLINGRKYQIRSFIIQKIEL